VKRPVIEARNLRFRYGDGAPALNGVNFRLDEGECVALLGPNGSGKTTFVLHLNGLLEGQGSIEVCGLPVERRNLPAIRRKIGLVFQDSESQLFMPTVLEDAAFGPINRGLSRPEALERAMAALKTVGMEGAAARAPYHLSAGEQKKVAIAGILATDPEILALDEPTTFLDPPGQRALAELLGALPQAKIIVTHNIPFALALCRRAVFFQGGVIVADGPVDGVVARFGWDFVTATLQPRR
jgi:cobalt/nickel transport system ATP-binding protein